MNMMKSFGDMQAKMTEMQDQLQKAEVTGTAGAGMVSVILNGKGEMKALKIDKSLLADGEVEIIEDLIIAAHSDARGKADREMQDKMAEMTAGLPFPPGMKFPF